MIVFFYDDIVSVC